MVRLAAATRGLTVAVSHSNETTPTDEALYRRLKAGDDDALDVLVTRHHRSIYQFLVRQTGDTALAEDFTQETFTRLLTKDIPNPQYLRAWLFTVARNLAYDHFRSAAYQREQATDFNDPVTRRLHASQTALPEDEFAAQSDRERVADALEKLSPEQREVVILRYYHEMKIADIAAVTGTPDGTVKGRLFHALRILKGILIRGSLGLTL